MFQRFCRVRAGIRFKGEVKGRRLYAGALCRSTALSTTGRRALTRIEKCGRREATTLQPMGGPGDCAWPDPPSSWDPGFWSRGKSPRDMEPETSPTGTHCGCRLCRQTNYPAQEIILRHVTHHNSPLYRAQMDIWGSGLSDICEHSLQAGTMLAVIGNPESTASGAILSKPNNSESNLRCRITKQVRGVAPIERVSSGRR